MASQAETNVLPFAGKYRPMYRLKPTDRWRVITRDKKPVECETASQAHRIARDLIDTIENPVHLLEEEPQPLGSIDDWRREKEAKRVAEQERAFGASQPSMIFLGGGKCTKVEYAKSRRRA